MAFAEDADSLAEILDALTELFEADAFLERFEADAFPEIFGVEAFPEILDANAFEESFLAKEEVFAEVSF